MNIIEQDFEIKESKKDILSDILYNPNFLAAIRDRIAEIGNEFESSLIGDVAGDYVSLPDINEINYLIKRIEIYIKFSSPYQDNLDLYPKAFGEFLGELEDCLASLKKWKKYLIKVINSLWQLGEIDLADFPDIPAEIVSGPFIQQKPTPQDNKVVSLDTHRAQGVN